MFHSFFSLPSEPGAEPVAPGLGVTAPEAFDVAATPGPSDPSGESDGLIPTAVTGLVSNDPAGASSPDAKPGWVDLFSAFLVHARARATEAEAKAERGRLGREAALAGPWHEPGTREGKGEGEGQRDEAEDPPAPATPAPRPTRPSASSPSTSGARARPGQLLREIMAHVGEPAVADTLPPDEIEAMIAAGVDPWAIDHKGRTRPRQPLPVLDVLALVRLAATLGDRAGVRALAATGALTLIDTGATAGRTGSTASAGAAGSTAIAQGLDLGPALAHVVVRGLLPGLPPVVRHLEDAGDTVARACADEAARANGAAGVASGRTSGPGVGVTGNSPYTGAASSILPPMAPVLVLASLEAETGSGRWRSRTTSALVHDALATSWPILVLPPEPSAPEPELLRLLPAPRRLVAFDRAIAVALLAATHSATGRVCGPEVLARLPSDRGLARLSLPAIALALREATAFDAARAMARLAGEVPGAGTTAGNALAAVTPSRPCLDDLSGMGPLEEAARMIVDDLGAWARGEALWCDITRSLLLHGETGTGKTFSAQCIAAGAGCPLVTTSLARLQEKGNLGDLLRELRRIVEEARTLAPCILFVDEIDSFGSRTEDSGRNSSYHRQVIAALLEVLDGVEGHEGVVVVGACNYPGLLDPAIKRPGRFDVVVEVSRPGPAGLLRVARHHLARDLAAGHLTDEAVAALLPRLRGLTPADVDAAVRLARSHARRERRSLGIDDVSRALTPVVELPAAVVRRAAVHEAGHAVAACVLGLGDVRRLALHGGGGTAEIRGRPQEGTLGSQIRTIALALAGREAERLLLGSISAGAGGPVGAGSDLELATTLASGIELTSGLGARGPLWSPPHWHAADRATLGLIEGHLARAEALARDVLIRHRGTVEGIAAALASHRALEGDELDELLAGLGLGNGDVGDDDRKADAGSVEAMTGMGKIGAEEAFELAVPEVLSAPVCSDDDRDDGLAYG